MNTTTVPSGFKFNGWHVLAMVVAFFALIIGVDTTFAIWAYRTFPGEVSVTPYEDGVAYNNKLAQMNAQAKLGWRPSAAVAPDGSVEVQVLDLKGQPITGLDVTGKMERPATEAGRIVPKFHEKAPGVYVATPGRLMGAWDLTFVLKNKAGDDFEAERRLIWP